MISVTFLFPTILFLIALTASLGLGCVGGGAMIIEKKDDVREAVMKVVLFMPHVLNVK